MISRSNSLSEDSSYLRYIRRTIQILLLISSIFLLNLAHVVHASNGIGLRVYAVAADFLTVRDTVTWNELQARWTGTDSLPLAMDQSTYDVLNLKLGNAGTNVHIIPSAEFASYAQTYPDAWLIVPFDTLSPRLKVLQIGGWDLFKLGQTGGEVTYPLAFPSSDPNYDPSLLTTIAMHPLILTTIPLYSPQSQ